MAPGCLVLPCYAMVFNDNMVAQAVAAPQREQGVGGGWRGLISEEAGDVYRALPLAVLNPHRALHGD